MYIRKPLEYYQIGDYLSPNTVFVYFSIGESKKKINFLKSHTFLWFFKQKNLICLFQFSKCWFLHKIFVYEFAYFSIKSKIFFLNFNTLSQINCFIFSPSPNKKKIYTIGFINTIELVNNKFSMTITNYWSNLNQLVSYWISSKKNWFCLFEITFRSLFLSKNNWFFFWVAIFEKILKQFNENTPNQIELKNLNFRFIRKEREISLRKMHFLKIF